MGNAVGVAHVTGNRGGGFRNLPNFSAEPKDPDPAVEKRLGDGMTNSTGGAGDHCDLAGERAHEEKRAEPGMNSPAARLEFALIRERKEPCRGPAGRGDGGGQRGWPRAAPAAQDAPPHLLPGGLGLYIPPCGL